jgi:hypothetical protein
VFETRLTVIHIYVCRGSNGIIGCLWMHGPPRICRKSSDIRVILNFMSLRWLCMCDFTTSLQDTRAPRRIDRHCLTWICLPRGRFPDVQSPGCVVLLHSPVAWLSGCFRIYINCPFWGIAFGHERSNVILCFLSPELGGCKCYQPLNIRVI